MKTTTTLISTFAILTVFSAVGCGAEDVGSESIRTSGMWANMNAISVDGKETKVEVELRVGGDKGTFIELEGDDKLIVSNPDEGSATLDHDSSGNRHWYNAIVTTADEDAEIKIAFERGEEDEGAPNSVVNMPKPFSMDVTEDSVARGTDVAITWDNIDGGKINWEIEGDCIDSSDGQTDDDMDFSIPGDLFEVDLLDEGESCEVTVTLSRVVDGDLDPAYGDGGSIQGIQRRAATFMSTPGPDEEGGSGGDGDGDGAGGVGGSR